MKKTLVEQYVENPVHMRLFQQERAIYEVTELLENLMRETGVTRTELARRLGRTKGWVTQLLDEEANKTIRTVADAFAVLGREYRSFYCPIRVGTERRSGVAPSEPWVARSSTVGPLSSVIKLHQPNGFHQTTRGFTQTSASSTTVSGAYTAQVSH